MTDAALMPALFLGHGSPMNAIEDNDFHRAWIALGRELPRPKAILCVSAHWQTDGTAVTAQARPETIHDFGGFPQALFDLRYPAPGDPALARRVAGLLAPAKVALDTEWGFDHGTWGVLVGLYPQADVPVLQLSLDVRLTPEQHYALAGRLAPLRAEGVLVLGSGNIVHNLRALMTNPRDIRFDWAERFDALARDHIERGEHAPLIGYERLGRDAQLSVPTPEHYLPLLYVLALRRPADRLRLLNTRVTSAISMTSVLFA